MKHIIEDWAGNVLNARGRFRPKGRSDHPTMLFDSLEDGWSWICEHIPDEDNAYDDVFVEPVEEPVEEKYD